MLVEIDVNKFNFPFKINNIFLKQVHLTISKFEMDLLCKLYM